MEDINESPKEVLEPVWGLRFVFDEERAQREVCFTKIPCTKIESILVCKLSFRTIKFLNNYLDHEVLSTITQPCVRTYVHINGIRYQLSGKKGKAPILSGVI